MSRITPVRNGLTLLEVLIATALLGMALTALAQLQSSGIRAALGAQLEAEAALICQSELDALISAATKSNDSPLANTRALQPVTSDPSWSRRIIVEPTKTPGLQSITIEIYRSNSPNTNPLAQLTRWLAIAPPGGDRP